MIVDFCFVIRWILKIYNKIIIIIIIFLSF